MATISDITDIAIGANPKRSESSAGKSKGGLMRYPMDLIDSASDYFQIDIIKYEQSGNDPANGIFGTKTETFNGPFANIDDAITTTTEGGIEGLFDGGIDTGNVRQISNTLKGKPSSETIILPVPSSIEDNNGVKWGEDMLNDLAAWGLAKIGGAINANTPEEMLKQAKDTITEAYNSKDSSRGTQAINYLKTTAAATAANALNANVTTAGLLARTTGQVVNQNVELLFNGVQLRTFNFAWDLVPRHSKESNVIKDIIKTLKVRMSPKLSGGKTGFLNSPDLFRISYKTGGKDHKFLNSFKTCALKNMSVNYTGSGTYATYEDGTPVHMQLNLTFTELNPIYSEDHKDTPGVGY